MLVTVEYDILLSLQSPDDHPLRYMVELITPQRWCDLGRGSSSCRNLTAVDGARRQSVRSTTTIPLVVSLITKLDPTPPLSPSRSHTDMICVHPEDITLQHWPWGHCPPPPRPPLTPPAGLQAPRAAAHSPPLCGECSSSSRRCRGSRSASSGPARRTCGSAGAGRGCALGWGPPSALRRPPRAPPTGAPRGPRTGRAATRRFHAKNRAAVTDIPRRFYPFQLRFLS